MQFRIWWRDQSPLIIDQMFYQEPDLLYVKQYSKCTEHLPHAGFSYVLRQIRDVMSLQERLSGKIPEFTIFRANAAFRELDGVPEDILPSCLYKKEKECFTCPSIQELRKYKVISSTFMSSFRLHNVGIMAGHFSHIFLVDASSVIEPEAMVALANLANESTVVTVTGAPGNHSGWIRSHIARENGLLISYFERLRQRKLYDSLDSKVITVL